MERLTLGRSPMVQATRTDKDALDLPTTLAAVLEGWRPLSVFVGGVSAVVLVVLLFLPRKFEARVSLSTVSNIGLSPTVGIAASLLGGAIQGGLQPTPPLVAELLTMPGVQRAVAEAQVPGTSERIIQRIARDDGKDSIRTFQIPEVMNQLMGTSVQRETGTITLRVTYRDSALARVIALETVEQTRRSFVSAAKAQAAEVRQAQEVRVDSASKQLARAEAALVQFMGRNRRIAPFTSAAVEQQRLQRAIDVAQQMYLQAVADRGAAVGKELQETPVLVVIDPLPPVLPPVPRRRVMKMLLAVFLASSVGAFALVFRESLRPRQVGVDGLERLRAAARALPGARRFRRDARLVAGLAP